MTIEYKKLKQTDDEIKEKMPIRYQITTSIVSEPCVTTTTIEQEEQIIANLMSKVKAHKAILGKIKEL